MPFLLEQTAFEVPIHLFVIFTHSSLKTYVDSLDLTYLLHNPFYELRISEQLSLHVFQITLKMHIYGLIHTISNAFHFYFSCHKCVLLNIMLYFNTDSVINSYWKIWNKDEFLLFYVNHRLFEFLMGTFWWPTFLLGPSRTLTKLRWLVVIHLDNPADIYSRTY